MNSIFVTFSSAQPQKVSTTGSQDYHFNTFTAWGYKSWTASGLPVANTAPVYMGVDSGKLSMAINTGSYFNWTLHPNQKESLSNIWVKGDVGDGVYLISY